MVPIEVMENALAYKKAISGKDTKDPELIHFEILVTNGRLLLSNRSSIEAHQLLCRSDVKMFCNSLAWIPIQ